MSLINTSLVALDPSSTLMLVALWLLGCVGVIGLYLFMRSIEPHQEQH
ncbi:MAG: hypothetical protein H6713_29260 [Myxococcales bacterium]|nr:hypothetical protein [Myxococcales bacterium]